MANFYLMHRNDKCGEFVLDDMTGRIISYKDYRTKLSPYLGNMDLQKAKKWWEMRAVPATRNMIQKIIKNTDCLTSELYLAKNLALSMTDSYWLCPFGMDLKYDDVKLSNLVGKLPYHNTSSYDPNASLGGQMEKYWDLDNDIPVLIKESSRYYGQQSINEVFATKLHELQQTQIPFVRYTAEKKDGHGIICRCPSFTSDNIELISAYEVIESAKPQNDVSLYDHYISICIQNGIDAAQIQDFMDYQTMTDFLISNTDEHLGNFGILRDSNTMKILGPAPIFDSGNSMFYDDPRKIPYFRAELLERKISGLYQTEEKMLAKVQNKDIVQLDHLPSPSDVLHIYTKAGLPEEKVHFLLENYKKKIELTDDFQHGKKISFYQEKKTEKETLSQAQPRLIVFCGLPGSGKTACAEHILQISGKEMVDSSVLYPIESLLLDAEIILDKDATLKKKPAFQPDPNTIAFISANDIRKEMQEKTGKAEENLVFFVAQVRAKRALDLQMTVVYDAGNLTAAARSNILQVADLSGTRNTELHIMPFPQKEVPGISADKMRLLQKKFLQNYPNQREGWGKIIEHGESPISRQKEADIQQEFEID